MIVETFQFNKEKGWTIDQFPKLDSENTLVLVFSAPEFIKYPKAIHELSSFYSNSTVIGCSTAGEIAGPYISDHSLSVSVVK